MTLPTLPSFLRRRTASAAAAVLLAGVFTAVALCGESKPGTALALRRDDTPVPRNGYEPASYANVVALVSPSVVKIEVQEQAPGMPGNDQFSPFDNPFFRQFFGQIPQIRPQPEEGLGSGVIISPDGYIATNNHVIAGAQTIKVTLADGRDYWAKAVGRDPRTDIAVIKIDARGLPAITFADSSKIEVGDRVLAIGNPFGIGETVTSGIVSATGRQVGILSNVKGLEDYIQTDAAINPGNSGGALVDSEGRLIGLNSAILSHDGGFQGVGFAVPSDLVSQVAESIVKYGKVVRGYLGVNIQSITPDLEQSFGLTSTRGALVTQVMPGAPASRAGIKEGDVIASVDGKPVADATDLALTVGAAGPGTRVKLGIIRDDKPIDVTVTTGTLPESFAGGEGSNSASDQGVLNGVYVDDISPQARQEFNIPPDLQGALITQVDPNSAAAQAGISAGDVILDIDHHHVASAQDAVTLSENATSKKTLLRLWSHGSTLFVVVDESQPQPSP